MALRRPMARQVPGKPTLDLELVGRVVHTVCLGKGCTGCDFRGWMIDPDAPKPAYPIDPYAGVPFPVVEA